MNRREFVMDVSVGAASIYAGIIPVTTADYLPRPRPAQLAWQEAELGLLYSYDMHIFDEVRYNQQRNRRTHFEDPNIFNPVALDTDQWLEAARACGARFAIITASHETGFRLWQSDANPYSVRNIRWGGGRRDVVGEFIESCRRVGVKPGVYLGARWNGQLGVLNFRMTNRSPLSQAEYNHLIEREVEEICSRYGELFEIWFDGGILAPAEGGPDVLPIFEKHQPDCLFYHSDERRDARWGGTESGTVGYPCWATIDLDRIRTGVWSEEVRQLLMHGDPVGKDWCPAMSDAPIRGYGGHEWFWEPDDEKLIYPVEDLVEMYYGSVGRNSTLILGATPDRRGLMPEADIERLKEMGTIIKNTFGRPVAQTSGSGIEIEIVLPRPEMIGHVILQEEIVLGERVRRYVVEGMITGGRWVQLCEGSCIGQKRIEKIDPVELLSVKLKIRELVAVPLIKNMAVYP